MSKHQLRLLIDPPGDAAWNMAVDEALLDRAIEHGEATLRFYRWSEPTLSLGYFQRYDDRGAHQASAALPCVRRHSGGGAIVHDRELTYSLALPATALPAGGAEACYDVAHEAILRVLPRQLPGCPPLRLSEGAIAKGPPVEPFLCFQRRSPGDVVAVRPGGQDDKVAGSAQRKRRGAVLQHGSLLLGRSQAAPELPGLIELAKANGRPEGRHPAATDKLADSLVNPLAEAIAGGLGAVLEKGRLAPRTVETAQRIAAARFSDPSWTRKR